MKKIFITGGSGTVGLSFIEKYYNEFKFYSYARGEKSQVSLKRRFPNVEIILGGIENYPLLLSEMLKVKPDIIIHAAALKHVDTAEKQPSQLVLINIIGSYNIINAAKNADVSLTVGISTDKACSPDNLYGQSKYYMERMFFESDNNKNRFVCCRFGNVAWSNGSVIPFWFSQKSQQKKLSLTDKKMNRLMFTSIEAADLIYKSILLIKSEKDSFILSIKMKTVNMFKLAELISKNIEVVGLRPGEKLDEDLISNEEIPYTKVIDNYILIKPSINQDKSSRIEYELNSQTADLMNTDEMMKILFDASNNANKSIIDKKLY